MKKSIILASLTFLTAVFSFAFCNTGSKSEGKGNSEIKWGSFNNGMKEAKQSNKKMIVDVYTDWCGWCKKMDKSTYTNSEVAEYINNNFIAVKLNAESQNQMNYMGQSYTEQQLAQGFGITGYPSTIFFDENQNPITVVPGYLEGKDMLNILKYIKDDIYKSKNFEEYMKSSQK